MNYYLHYVSMNTVIGSIVVVQNALVVAVVVLQLHIWCPLHCHASYI